MPENISFGNIVRERRQKLGLTQNELARRVGCAPITIRKIEYDSLRPSVQMAKLLALALNIPEEEQLGFVRMARKKERTTPIPTPSPMPGEIGMADLSGRSVKEFRLGERIGSGGFGVVYRAQQPSVNRDVAVKIILPRFANNPNFIRRFEAEAQLVAHLEHPHIVPLYDYWREPDAAYLIMRLLRGGSLEDRLAEGPVALADIRQTTQQIGLALDAAHRQGIIHRDIKPANVLLDEDKNAYLVDFGIAKSLDNMDGQSLTEGGAVIGSPAYISPEQILAEPVGPQSDIYCLGIMLFEVLTNQKPFPGPTPVAYIQQHLNDPLPSLAQFNSDLPQALDGIIERATAKKIEDRYPNTIAFLDEFEKVLATAVSPTDHHPVQVKTAVPPISTQEIAALENPYCGLRAFTAADAANFYGRDALIQEILAMMSDGSDLARFTAVVGPSGSGKSSVVKAGLIPSLRRGGLPNSNDWYILDLTPSSHPWEEVEAALFRVAVNPPDSLLPMLQEGNRGLLRAVRRVLPDDGSQLLLVIDQFEELFTLVENETLRADFLAGLVTAVLDPPSRLQVVITLRADFTDRPLQYVDFGELMRQRTAFVLPLTPDELNQAITQPIIKLGMAMEPELTATIIREVGDQPGMLPLLQYALTELFEQRQGRTLTLEAYRDTGGVTGALARRADEIFNSMEQPAQEATRQLFLRLITLGEGVEDTRRRVLLRELESLSDQSSIANGQLAIVNEYGKHRLLTFDHDPVSREGTVEVAHEALLREWPRLRNWVSSSREDVRRQRLLADAATQWQNADQDNSYLLHGSRLVEFESWKETTTVALTTNEQSFLTRSINARVQRHAEEEARRQNELETAQQLAEEQARRAEEQTQAAQSLRKRALYLTGSLVVAAILAVAAFGFARSSTNNANLAATREAEAFANLILASTSEADAIRNADLAATREAEAEAERETAVAAQQQAEEESNFRATAEAIALEQQTAAEQEKTIADQQRAFAEEQLLLSTSRELALAANANLETNPERSLLLALQALDNAYTVEAEEMLRAALQASRVELTLTNEQEHIEWVAYHPDGTWLAGIGNDGILMIWDADSGDTLQTIPLDITGASRLSISPDGLWMAVASQNKILLLDSNSFEVARILEGHSNKVITIEFSPDSTLLASGGEDALMKLWQIPTGEEQFSVVATDSEWVEDVTFSHDGTRLATGGDDATVRIWDVFTGEELAKIPQDAGFTLSVAFNADDTFVYSALLFTNSGQVVIWDVAAAINGGAITPVAEWFSIHENVTTHVKTSPDGRYIATASGDSTIKVWDATQITPEEIMTLLGHEGEISEIAFSPDSQSLVSTSAGTARVWNISEAGSGEIMNIAESMRPVAFSPDNLSLVSGSGQGIIKIWDVTTGQQLESFDSQVEPSSAAVSPDGSFLALSSQDVAINIWDLTTQQLVSTLSGHGSGLVGFRDEGVLALDFSPDSTLLASAGADGHAIVWNFTTGEKVYDWRVDPANSDDLGNEHNANGASAIRFSPNGRFLAVGTDVALVEGEERALVKVYDLENGDTAFTFSDAPSLVRGLRFSPDSTLLVGTGIGGFIILWDVTTGELFANLVGATNTIGVVHFSNDGKRLFTGRTETVVWDLETQAALFQLPGAWAQGALTHDGRYLAAIGPGGILIYTLDFEELVAIAQSRVTRSLTDAECREYLHVDVCPEN